MSVELESIPMKGGNRITFACCVEFGTLEEGTIRLVESLRKFGGGFADARFVAVTPRGGPPLARQTLRRFSELDVHYVRISPRNRYAWQPYLNKYFALREAEKVATGDLVAWVDSDVLVLKPPTEMLLASDEDFGACPRDKNVGSGGPHDELEPYWSKVCADVSLRLDDLPWVRTTADDERIRLYWNAGIFVYRPSSGFIDVWRKAIEDILDRTDKSTLDKIFWVDQIALGLAAVLTKLRLKHLSGGLNYGIATHFKDHLSSDGLSSAELLHYHNCMRGENWGWFMDTIAGPLPDVHSWLQTLGPVSEPKDLPRQIIKSGYKAARQVRRRIWSRQHGGGMLGR